MRQLAVKLGYDTLLGIAPKNENWLRLSRTQGSVLHFLNSDLKSSQAIDITHGCLYGGPSCGGVIPAYNCGRLPIIVGIVVGKIGVLKEVRPIGPLESLSRVSFQTQIKFNIKDFWPFWPFQHVQGGVLG